MALDVTTEIVIDRPCAEVAAYAGDPTNAPRWYTNISSVRWRSEPPMVVGSTMDFVAKFMGRRMEYTYQVAELEPGRKLVMRTTDGPFAMETTYTWTPDGDNRTRMELRNRGGPTGIARIADPLAAWGVRRATRKDLAALKRTLEGGPV
jgi:uncharacterized protein YndB with AHSA1/START domain